MPQCEVVVFDGDQANGIPCPNAAVVRARIGPTGTALNLCAQHKEAFYWNVGGALEILTEYKEGTA